MFPRPLAGCVSGTPPDDANHQPKSGPTLSTPQLAHESDSILTQTHEGKPLTVGTETSHPKTHACNDCLACDCNKAFHISIYTHKAKFSFNKNQAGVSWPVLAGHKLLKLECTLSLGSPNQWVLTGSTWHLVDYVLFLGCPSIPIRYMYLGS